jgi:hypothetical protein
MAPGERSHFQVEQRFSAIIEGLWHFRELFDQHLLESGMVNGFRTLGRSQVFVFAHESPYL